MLNASSILNHADPYNDSHRAQPVYSSWMSGVGFLHGVPIGVSVAARLQEYGQDALTVRARLQFRQQLLGDMGKILVGMSGKYAGGIVSSLSWLRPSQTLIKRTLEGDMPPRGRTNIQS